MLIGSDDKVWFENYLNSVDSDDPLSPTLSPQAGKGSQTRLPSPSLPAGRDLGWGNFLSQISSSGASLMTQIGLMFEGQAGVTWARWQRLLQAAEDFGYQCVFRSDHFSIRPPYEESLEAWVSLTYAASHSQRIELGSLVSPITFPHPALFARMAASVDDLSNGRLLLRLGAGWNEHEHTQFSIPFYDKATLHEFFAAAIAGTTLP